MLTRNAVRRQQRYTASSLAAAFAQLNLPWLAPAQVQWQASHATHTSTAPHSPRRRRSSASKSSAPRTRALATAADQYSPRHATLYPPPGYDNAFRNSNQDRNIPWDASPQSTSKLSSLRPANDPIILDWTTKSPDATVKVSHGIQGTAVDLLQHLHTFLQIGRTSTAEVIIKRIAELCPTTSAELLHAHTIYLEHGLRRMSRIGMDQEEREEQWRQMQRWFDGEVRGKDTLVDAKLLVVMIRASLRALTGPQLETIVHSYVSMAEQLDEEDYYEVLESEEYDDSEFALLTELLEGEAAIAETGAPTAAFEPLRDGQRPQYRRSDPLSMEQLPDVRPTEQRGGGLADVKRSLQDLRANPSLSADAAIEEQHEAAFKRQKILEETAVEVAVDRWRRADEELRRIGIHSALQSRPVSALMWQWYSALLPLLKAELLECKKALSQPDKTDHDRYHYGPYLELLPPEKIAASTILYVLNRMNGAKRNYGKAYETEVKLGMLTIGLAREIEEECMAGSSKQNRRFGKHHSRNLRKGKQSKQLASDSGKKMSKAEARRQTLLGQLGWPLDARVKLGAFLVSKLIESAQLPVTRKHPRTGETVTQLQPAFLHRTKFEKGKRQGLVCPNPALMEKIVSEPLGGLLAKRMPMLVEPKPWKGWNEGGYLHYSNPILRLPSGDRSGKDYFIAANKKGDMSQIYAGLTALGSVPWKIHHGVFKVQLEAWNSGEEVANFAPLHPALDVPKLPEAADGQTRRKWLLEMREVENKRSGLHSKRCFQNFQLEIARTMVNETLYFPHSLDFRGRAYPIPPYMNHMGADNVRGLLVFANGKELGPNGLRWLKIHLATVAGHDKASMAERIEFTMSHLDDIYDSVRNPLNGKRWWLKAEDAWQTLAACYELTAALDSPDPTKFVSHLPIQQDGTCNGLQHYAALGGDPAGAAQVNLEPGDRPADVYTAVMTAVVDEVRKDAAAGNLIAQKLDGRITRKCVKQPVMTNVYGVTFFGAKEQVFRQLEVLFPEVKAFDAVNLGNMSQYIATKIFKSLGEMFEGAQAIQHWLGVCADRISTCITPQQIADLTKLADGEMAKKAGSTKDADAKSDAKPTTKKRAKKRKETSQLEALAHQSTGTSASNAAQTKTAKPLFKSTVVWTTPLRLPVVQPYRSLAVRPIQTSLQRIQISDPQVWHPVSKRKQLQAFPPNFIHSLDATHMLLSALKCKEVGMTFASIHDSFWTHACDVDRLSMILRDAFIEMHKDNVVGRLREEFQTRYKGCMYLASVVANSPVGKKITKLRKEKHRQMGSGELAAEVERLRLLDSADPEERKRGEAMVTPGSVLAKFGDEAIAEPEIRPHQLGTILEGKDNAADGESDLVAAAEDDGTAATNASADETTQAFEAQDASEQGGEGKPAKPKAHTLRKLYVWQPLTFPEIPPRGSFDVRKIRDSAYFFH
ncbi:hypothetical protein BDY17DRAFT_296952 [Neohortaea acidophila]|uniref:DNA-directed RNA polymerase n=1 Tax=Neohortaea acidophila TaxID=245834 RepID=A0A6A6PTG3_9PEZI|nr:uncharacterized protein BDY17DRAFT_296952 [Neohortaea acidophila]KAF2483175.1 hypothetical protein BDY17DRAFT_296952 [Neohortaea acidophila]